MALVHFRNIYDRFLSFPAGLYWRVQLMDLVTYAIPFIVLTILSTWLVAYAYRNVKVALKHK